ncbi:MAG: transketolase [Planctomycetes bacterium]|nr:transketolase [Planctomycetota bacterium]
MSEIKKNPGLSQLDELCIQTIRFLSMEGVQAAKSGHPGMTMGMAPAAYVLWSKYMNHNPANPTWQNRDRFILSAGHGGMLLYSLLHLNGYDISLDDLKNFRQLGSKTAGHPEFNPSRGIEATTGPLGQGLSNAVGMAIEEKHLASIFNRDGFPIIDHKIYSICGDGCMQEGLSSESCSLAGHLGLDNLVLIYDDNHITIDGDTAVSFTEDVAKRFEAYGWHVEVVGGDGNDMESFEKALQNAENAKGKPSLIKIRTHIAYGSPNLQDTAKAHGSPLGDDEIALIKEKYGWDPDKSFVVPKEVKDRMATVQKKGAELGQKWNKMFADYSNEYPELAMMFSDAIRGKVKFDIDEVTAKFEAGSSMATRKASGITLDTLMPKLPFVIGGSADLTPSNNTWFTGAQDYQKNNPSGRYIRYGVREHAMGAIMNGMAVGGMIRPYGGTFMVFSDYMRGAVRVAAISKYPSIFIWTHDSIGVGEDGPTHQPVEQLASLRAIPNLIVFRPADAYETAYAWEYILKNNDRPAALLLTRQGLPILDQEKYGSAAVGVTKGAYVVVKTDSPDVQLLASGSEVSLAMQAADKLAQQSIKAQVVSMVSWELFEEQSQQYKDNVILPGVKARVGVEAAIELGWHKYIGDKGEFVGMKGFGTSGPQNLCFEHFGITVDAVVEAAKKSIAK